MEIDLTKDDMNGIVSYLAITKSFISTQKERTESKEDIKILDAQLKYLDTLIQKLSSSNDDESQSVRTVWRRSLKESIPIMYRNLCKMCDVTDPLWFTPDGSVK